MMNYQTLVFEKDQKIQLRLGRESSQELHES